MTNPDAEMVPLPKSIQAGDTTYFVDAVLRQLDREVADGCGLAIPQKNMRRMVENLFRRIAELVRARDESVSLITAERERMDKQLAELEAELALYQRDRDEANEDAEKWCKLHADISCEFFDLQSDLAAAREDAGRYRFVKRDDQGRLVEKLAYMDGENWDAAIDAARKGNV